ncbi:amidase family protein [Nanoarchaeota archaeon]
MIKEFVKKTQTGEIDIVENAQKIIEETKKIQNEFKYMNVISEELALQQAKVLAGKNDKEKSKLKLFGLPMSVKDCLTVQGVESRAGSKILSGYKPLFNATAVQKCVDQGAIIIGKNSQDEFGFGSFNVNVGVGFDTPLNPFDKERACGGSSGGSAGFTKKIAESGFVHSSLGESTGGSIVCPASFCGVIGLCPTYGRVSRYGLMDYANSLDKIGPMTTNVDDARQIMNIIAGYDERDSTSVPDQPIDLDAEDTTKPKIAIIKETFAEGVDEEVKKTVLDAANKLGVEGVDEISLPLVNKYGVATYYLLAMSETSTNLAKYCGIRYGKHEELKGTFNEYFTDVRSKNFGKEAKRRIVVGTFARMAGQRDAFYIKALKVRTKIIEEYKKAFKKYDILISPTMPVVAPKFDEISKMTPLQNYMMDIMTVGPNVAGLPHINIPVGTSKKMPIGLMAIADHFREYKLLNASSILE